VGQVTIYSQTQNHNPEQSAKTSYLICGECPMNLTTANFGKQYRRDFWELKDFSLKTDK